MVSRAGVPRPWRRVTARRLTLRAVSSGSQSDAERGLIGGGGDITPFFGAVVAYGFAGRAPGHTTYLGPLGHSTAANSDPDTPLPRTHDTTTLLSGPGHDHNRM